MPTDLAGRAIAYVVALLLVMAGLAWAVHEFNALRAKAARVPGLEQAVRDAATTLDTERKAAAKAQEISRGYQTDLVAIRAERDRLRNLPPRVVRVLVPAPAPVVQRADPAGRPRATRPDPVELAGEAGGGPRLSRDIGADIFGIADDSDEREALLAAQVTRLQQAYAVAAQGCSGVIP